MCHEIDCGWGGVYTTSRGVGGIIIPGYGRRRFPTREGIIGLLEEYLKNPQAQVKGVEERIAELRESQA